jgi:hypothetical protein
MVAMATMVALMALMVRWWNRELFGICALVSTKKELKEKAKVKAKANTPETVRIVSTGVAVLPLCLAIPEYAAGRRGDHRGSCYTNRPDSPLHVCPYPPSSLSPHLSVELYGVFLSPWWIYRLHTQ